MPQGMAVDPLADRSRLGRFFDTLLQTVFMNMVPPGHAATRVHGQPSAGKDKLPDPFPDRIRIFPGQGIRKEDLA